MIKATLLMILSEEKWQYLFVTQLLALFRKIISKHNGDFYRLSCLHSFRAKEKRNSPEKVYNNSKYCKVNKNYEEKNGKKQRRK